MICCHDPDRSSILIKISLRQRLFWNALYRILSDFFDFAWFSPCCIERSGRKRFRASQWKIQKGSINGSYDLNSSGFEKGDTARRSRTTERSELVSEEAEQHRDNIRHLRAVVKKWACCFYVWLSWFRVICPPDLRKVIHRHCAFKRLIFSSWS